MLADSGRATGRAYVLVERFERIMATPVGVHVAVPPEQTSRAHAAVEDCLAWLREVDRRLTRFSAESELCRLNAASGTWQSVSATLFAVMEQAVAAAAASDGLFDPTLLPVLEALGYDRDFGEIAYRDVDAAPAADDSATIDAWRGIELDRTKQRIRLPAGARLDLGGIAKGWAADVALEGCFTALPDVLIDVGGDVRSRGGPRPGERWPIGIGDPRDAGNPADPTQERCAAVLTLGRGGLATSGATLRWWRRRGELCHHLIDPRTQRPMRLWTTGDDADGGADLLATATALAPTAAQAEVAAKVALLRGYPECLRSVEAEWERWRAAGDPRDTSTAGEATGPVALLLVLGSGDVVCSKNMRDYLATVGGGGELWLD